MSALHRTRLNCCAATKRRDAPMLLICSGDCSVGRRPQPRRSFEVIRSVRRGESSPLWAGRHAISRACNFERKCSNMPGDPAGRRGGAASCRPERNTDLLRTLLRVLTPKPHTALGMYNYNQSTRLRRRVPRCIASCKLGSAGRRSEPLRGRQQGSFRSPVSSKLRCAPEPPFAAMMAGAEIVIEIGIGNRKTRLSGYSACRERPELRAAPNGDAEQNPNVC